MLQLIKTIAQYSIPHSSFLANLRVSITRPSYIPAFVGEFLEVLSELHLTKSGCLQLRYVPHVTQILIRSACAKDDCSTH